MITAVSQNWIGRVLDQRRLGIPVKESWKLEAYEQNRARLQAPEYPCFFGQSGEARRALFIDPATSQPIAASVRQRIHKRMLAYDGMTVHPDIGFYGNAGNREWKQYALPDDNEPEAGACPFQNQPPES
jgi:FPC/CPF motif-containing protein YcgG